LLRPLTVLKTKWFDRSLASSSMPSSDS